jgi:hypothetical protein
MQHTMKVTVGMDADGLGLLGQAQCPRVPDSAVNQCVHRS